MGCGTPSGFNVIWKKEEKINLYFYFSDIIKRTRIVTRLSPSRVEHLGLPGLLGAPGESPRPHCVSVIPSAEHECRDWHISLLSAFRLMQDSFLLLPFKGHHLSALNQFQPASCIMCLDPAHSGFVFYVLLIPYTVFKQWLHQALVSEWLLCS